MNVVRLDGNKLWTKTADVARLELGLLEDAEIKDNVLLCSVGVFPLEPSVYVSEDEVLSAWNELYPNGKPKPEIIKQAIGEEEKALDFAKYIMNSPEILLKLGIQTRLGV